MYWPLMVLKERGGGEDTKQPPKSMSLVNVIKKKKEKLKTQYLRSCDFQANIAMVNTLGFEATDAEKSLTLHAVSGKTEIIQCISDERA